MLGRAVTYEGRAGEAGGLHGGDPTTRAEHGLLALDMSAELGAHPAPGRGGVSVTPRVQGADPSALHKSTGVSPGPGLASADFSLAWDAVSTYKRWVRHIAQLGAPRGWSWAASEVPGSRRNELESWSGWGGPRVGELAEVDPSGAARGRKQPD